MTSFISRNARKSQTTQIVFLDRQNGHISNYWIPPLL